MPLQETSGTASYDAFGGGAAVEPVYIEQIFSTWLYTGNGSTQTITNGIDLAGKGGLVWGKARNFADDHVLIDTARGASNYLSCNNNLDQQAALNGLTAFNSTGFSIGSANILNSSTRTYASWTFRKQPKFFDVVTYTGTGSNTTISHSLGSVPACIMVKRTDTTSDWFVYHIGLTSAGYSIRLNTTAAQSATSTVWNSTAPTSTVFSVGTSINVNASGGTYVAYLFAHNAGGFGLTGTDNVISCGSFTTDASGNATVNLGYEPQWYLVKRTDGIGAWGMADIMRGMTVQTSGNSTLVANSSNAESTISSFPPQPNATGFSTTGISESATHIYIAIRRGPMKTPTSGTSVFAPQATAGATDGTPNSNRFTSNFPIDLFITAYRAGSSSAQQFQDRLRSPSQVLISSSTAAETSGNAARLDDMDGVYFTTTVGANSNIGSWMFRRAPGFFDEVCYTGTGSATTFNHNLGVAPELMILKTRTGSSSEWPVYAAPLGATQGLYLGPYADPAITTSGYWNNTSPTSSVFTVGNASASNFNGGNFVAYLFASCPGVSKVTNFTGNGSTQTINCGFTTGARFVLIKATSTTGNWLVFDTARGMTTSTDPWLALNSTAAESATTGACTTTSVGFTVDESKLTGVNTNGVSYIALAVA